MEIELKTFREIREMKFSSADERMDYMIKQICNYRFVMKKMLINGVDKTSKEYENIAHAYLNVVDDWAKMYVIKFIDQNNAVYKSKQQLIKEHAQELYKVITDKEEEIANENLKLN